MRYWCMWPLSHLILYILIAIGVTHAANSEQTPMNAQIRFHLPGNVSFENCKIVPISQMKQKKGALDWLLGY